MIVVDSSAILAILLGEPERDFFYETIKEQKSLCLSRPNYVETCMVAQGRRGDELVRIAQSFIENMEIELAELSLTQARLAIEAFRRYGKGRHPAGLNFGDCFAYALAKERGAPLLCKGEDFTKTDMDILPAPGA